MKGEKNHNDESQVKDVGINAEVNESNTTGRVDQPGEQQEAEDNKLKEIEELKKKLEDKTKQCDDYYGMLQRTAAEFDNFKKRTLKEREASYIENIAEAVGAFLPVIDNLERAIQQIGQESEGKSIKDGVELILKQIMDIVKTLGAEEINCIGEKFDPNLHNAVIHVEDGACEDNIIIEEFQRGYILKDRIIRHSMVKVAN